jgi:O-acetyl-ADP-ribose deacetylase (regulator of RNase III)
VHASRVVHTSLQTVSGGCADRDEREQVEAALATALANAAPLAGAAR